MHQDCIDLTERRVFGSDDSSGLSRTVRALLTALLILGMPPGCGTHGSDPTAKANKPTGRKTAASHPEKLKPKPKLAPSVPADAFPDVASAIESLKIAAKDSDTESFVRAEQWIVMQGDVGVEPLGQILNDPQAEMEHRIAVCRTLRRLGPKAKVPFKQALSDASKQIQLNAIKGLGLIEPTDQDIIQTLDAYLDGDDVRTRTEAIFALANIGAPAKEAVGEKLVKMLNDPNENDAIRGAARRALDEVAPRHTFVDR